MDEDLSVAGCSGEGVTEDVITLIHASDVHFGKRHDSEAMAAFQGFLKGAEADLLVISGDLTQRAKVKEYGAARAFLQELEPLPVVVTPGNHDVPLYRVFERIFRPLANYQTYISRELDSVTEIPGVTLVSINSTAPRRAIVNGRIRDSQLRFAAEAFQKASPGHLRVLVTHHNLLRAPDYEPEQILPGQGRILSMLSRMGVDLILGGHLHRSYVGSSADAYSQPPGTRPIIIAHTGTTTSSRGRGKERGRNSLNLIQISPQEMVIIPHLLDRAEGAFHPTERHTFPRKGVESE